VLVARRLSGCVPLLKHPARPPAVYLQAVCMAVCECGLRCRKLGQQGPNAGVDRMCHSMSHAVNSWHWRHLQYVFLQLATISCWHNPHSRLQKAYQGCQLVYSHYSLASYIKTKVANITAKLASGTHSKTLMAWRQHCCLAWAQDCIAAANTCILSAAVGASRMGKAQRHNIMLALQQPLPHNMLRSQAAKTGQPNNNYNMVRCAQAHNNNTYTLHIHTL
jgi:hypothetical protein